MQAINPADWPFTTNNAALAFCLYMSGVPFCDDKHPCINRYDADILFRLGGGIQDASGTILKPSRYAGMNPEDAVKQAVSEGKKGDVLYGFKRPNEMADLLNAFSEQERELKDGTGTAQEVQLRIIKQFANGKVSENIALLLINCVCHKMRGQFMSLWKTQRPMISARHGKITKRKTDNGEVHRMPGVKMMSVGASPAIKKHLNA